MNIYQASESSGDTILRGHCLNQKLEVRFTQENLNKSQQPLNPKYERQNIMFRQSGREFKKVD